MKNELSEYNPQKEMDMLYEHLSYYMDYEEKMDFIVGLIKNNIKSKGVYLDNIIEDVWENDFEVTNEIARIYQTAYERGSEDCLYTKNNSNVCDCQDCPYDEDGECFESIVTDIEEQVFCGYYPYYISIDQVLYDLISSNGAYNNYIFRCSISNIDSFCDLICCYSSESYDQLSDLTGLDERKDIVINHPQQFMFQELAEGKDLSSIYRYGQEFILTELFKDGE